MVLLFFQPQLEEAVVNVIGVVCLGNEVFLQQSLDGRDNRAGGRQVIFLDELASRYGFDLSLCGNGQEYVALFLRHLTKQFAKDTTFVRIIKK